MKYRIDEQDFREISDGTRVYRIVALADFLPSAGSVRIGDRGGFVGSYDNLSQVGTCWLFGDSMVFGKATVIEDASLHDHARAFGKAHIGGTAVIIGQSIICGEAVVMGDSRVMDQASVTGKATIRGFFVVSRTMVIEDGVHG